MTFSLGWNKALGRGEALWLSWLKVRKLLAVLKYDIHWMSLEVVTRNDNKKMTVCFLLIVPMTWFHFSYRRFLISWGNARLLFILQIFRSYFLHVSVGVSEFPNQKITDTLHLPRVILAILCCIERTNSRDKVLSK